MFRFDLCYSVPSTPICLIWSRCESSQKQFNVDSHEFGGDWFLHPTFLVTLDTLQLTVWKWQVSACLTSLFYFYQSVKDASCSVFEPRRHSAWPCSCESVQILDHVQLLCSSLVGGVCSHWCVLFQFIRRDGRSVITAPAVCQEMPNHSRAYLRLIDRYSVVPPYCPQRQWSVEVFSLQCFAVPSLCIRWQNF